MAKIGGTRSKFIPGDHDVIDDISGQKHKRSQMLKNWKNQLVSKANFEVKHPQLTIRPRKEQISVTDTRTRGEDPDLQDPPFTSSQIV